jgi:hypothetical protein
MKLLQVALILIGLFVAKQFLQLKTECSTKFENTVCLVGLQQSAYILINVYETCSNDIVFARVNDTIYTDLLFDDFKLIVNGSKVQSWSTGINRKDQFKLMLKERYANVRFIEC